MKLINRERVDGTLVTIGNRAYYKKKNAQGKTQNKKNGQEDFKTSRWYAAEYRDSDGKQVCINLKTKSKAKARRMAIEIQQDLEQGIERVAEKNLNVTVLVDVYQKSVELKGAVHKTKQKYRSDLDKFKSFCDENSIKIARRFSETNLCEYRKWLQEGNYKSKYYADKSVEAAVVLVKQMFKWAWRQGHLRDYRLAGASFPKAKASPQPCFTSEQVDNLINVSKGEEKLAFALMGYAGLRIGEVEQLHWTDIQINDGRYTMIHIRRGGSEGTPKDKDERFVPVHPRVAELLGTIRHKTGLVFLGINERKLLKRAKELCRQCEFDNPRQYKLHSFRHYFASLCANHNIAYRKALAWLGHSSSEMLELYYHLHDEESQQAMIALANSSLIGGNFKCQYSPHEGNLRATGQYKIEKTLQVPQVQKLINSLSDITERAGFEPAVL